VLELPTRKDGAFHVVVESPRGGRAKLKYDPELGAFTLSRPLVNGLAYPYDWGFIPSTCAPDGDPLDAMVLLDVPTYPGVVLACRALAVVKVSQKGKKGRGRERNDRVLAVSVDDRRPPRTLSARQKKELEAFFLSAVLLEDKEARIEGWGGAREAERVIREAERLHARAAGATR
jgi:inorganic pyrophosphatase